MRWGAVTRPILPSAGLGATGACYEVLGFGVSGRSPDYLIMVGPDQIELHFCPSRTRPAAK